MREYSFTIQAENGKVVKRPATWYRKRNKCLAMAHAALIEVERKAATIARLTKGGHDTAQAKTRTAAHKPKCKAGKAVDAPKVHRFIICLKARKAA